MKKWLLAVLCLFLLCALVSLAESEREYGFELGDKLKDFSVTTISGETFTLSEVLKEKDMVLINIWASWCDPCRSEFPYMQAAYEEYKDDIEIIALSKEPEDTMEVLTAYAESLSLTFPIARDTAGLSAGFDASSIPTSIVIDRYGVICLRETGALTSKDLFKRIFDAFIGDGYTSSAIFTSIPGAMPSVEATNPAFLRGSLEVATSRITLKNPESRYTWPMIMNVDSDGFSVISSNTNENTTKAQLDVVIDAYEGETFVLNYALSSEFLYDYMHIYVNGERVHTMSGEHPNASYAYLFKRDGVYTVSITYEKNSYGSEGDDCVTLRSIRLLSGAEAEKALAKNPVYPDTADELLFFPANPEIRKIEFTDPYNALYKYFGEAEYYITNLDEATFHVMLADGMVPGSVFAHSSYDGKITPALYAIDGDYYAFSTDVDSPEATGYIGTLLSVYYLPGNYDENVSIILLRNENAADLIVKQAIGQNIGAWKYVENPIKPVKAPETGEIEYTILFTDESGAPVSGVMAQVCNDDVCVVYTSDENGECNFSLDPYAYEVHVLKVPAGFQYTSSVYTLSRYGGETEITLYKK